MSSRIKTVKMPNNAENVEAPDYVNYSGKDIGKYTQEEACGKLRGEIGKSHAAIAGMQH